MRTFILLFLCVVLFVGCGSAPRKEFVDACYSYAFASCEQHIKYIDADKALSQEDKDVRTKATQEFFKMVEEEYERQQPEK